MAKRLREGSRVKLRINPEGIWLKTKVKHVHLPPGKGVIITHAEVNGKLYPVVVMLVHLPEHLQTGE